MPIFRRTNCIITASGIVTLCTVQYSMPDESRESALIVHCALKLVNEISLYYNAQDCNVTYILLMNKGIVH